MKTLGIRLALVALLGSAELFPQSAATRFQELVQQGEMALSRQQYAQAESAFEGARKLNPAIAEVHARLGLVYYQQGKFEAAIPTLRQALKLKPGLPSLDILLGMSLAETGKFSDAFPALEKGFRTASHDPALKRMTGLQLQRAYTATGKDNKAVEVALEMVKLYPDDAEVLYHASRLFGNFAYLNLRRLSEVAPDSIWRHQAAGEAYESQGSFDLAVAKYREVLALDPKRPGIHYRIGRTLLAKPQAEANAEALAAFEAELTIDPGNANAAYEAGELHRKAGRQEAAVTLFAVAVKIDPDFGEALIGLGRTLVSQNQPAAALSHLRRAVQIAPANEAAFFALAQAHRAAGNATEADRALAEYQRLKKASARSRLDITRPVRDVTRQESDLSARPD